MVMVQFLLSFMFTLFTVALSPAYTKQQTWNLLAYVYV